MRETQLHSGCVLIRYCHSNGGKVVDESGAWLKGDCPLFPH